MSWSFGNISAVVAQDGGGNVTCNAPTFSAGDLLVIATGAFSGSLTLATPAGWVQISSGLTNSFYMFARVATGGDAMPVLAWGVGAVGWGVCESFSAPGLVDNTSIVVDSNSVSRSGTNSAIVGAASLRTPAQPNCLALFAGQKNKSATSNSAVVTATDSNFTQDYGAAVTGGTQITRTVQHWIQTTATGTLGGANVSIADSATFRSMLVFLQAPPVAPDALLSWPKQIFVTETLIQS